MTTHEGLTFRDPAEMAEVYGEPCNACTLWDEGLFCIKRHRQKDVDISFGHIPVLTVRKIGGCPDHSPKSGVWWHEDPIKPHQSGYGGSSTNILV